MRAAWLPPGVTGWAAGGLGAAVGEAVPDEDVAIGAGELVIAEVCDGPGDGEPVLLHAVSTARAAAAQAARQGTRGW